MTDMSMTKNKVVIVFLMIVLIPLFLLLQGFVVPYDNKTNHFQNFEIIRDSLDRVNYPIVTGPTIQSKRMVVLKVSNQEEWDNLVPSLKGLLTSGHKNIVVEIIGKGIIFGEKENVITDLNYPDANIRVEGGKSGLMPAGVSFSKKNNNAVRNGLFYTIPYGDFNINDIIIDNKGKEIKIREEVRLVDGNIEKAPEQGSNIWKFKVDMPNLTENVCNDFYVLLTREWTSGRHKVIKVEGGWLYFNLDTPDIPNDNRNPNIDWQHFNVRPRYCLINSPVSKGIHIVNGKIYIPNKIKSIRIVKSGCLLSFASCHLNSLVISGFKVNGSGNKSLISLYACTFEDGAFITNNHFVNLSDLAIYVGRNNNVTISKNIINNTRVGAIEGGGMYTTIYNNKLSNIGWMLNSRAIIGGGEFLHICDNVIEDFNYAAITCGSTNSNEKARKLTYIIERNKVRLTKKYTDNFIQNTLADGGGIYIGPQCTQGVIRNNIIENIKGIRSNRGILLDDGAKNLAIYGNFIINTDNSYDIDLRFCDTYKDRIPDHNTNNFVFQNIMTGGYRFQDNGVNSNCACGQNVILGCGKNQKTVVGSEHRVDDIKIEGVKQAGKKIVLPKSEKYKIDGLVLEKVVKDYIKTR